MPTENRRIARAAGTVAVLTLASRIAGLVRDAVVGYYFGAGAAADAFFVAWRVPNLLRRFVAEGAMGVAFIPVFTEYLTQRSRREAVHAASVLATLMAAVLLLLSALGVACAPLWTALFAPGFVGDPEKFALTVSLTRVVFPYILMISLVALLAGILNVLRHFAMPALSPLVLNLTMITAVMVVCPRLAQPIRGLAYAVLVGGGLQLALQIVPLWRHGIRIRPVWQPRHPAVRRALGLMAPMLFGAAVYQINIMLGTVLASLLPGGSVSYLWYADRVFEFPLGIFVVALGTAALPSFSAQAVRGAHAEMRHSLVFAMRLATFLILPATVGMITLAIPIIAVLFGRGAFGFAQVVLTAEALSAFAIGLWSVSMVRLVVPAFYALGDTLTPVLTASVAFAVNALCSVMLMGAVPAPAHSGTGAGLAAVTQVLAVAQLRHAGLALATSIAATVNLILLLMRLQRRLGRVPGAELLRSAARSLAAALAMICPIRAITALVVWSEPTPLRVRVLVLTAAMTVGVMVFTLVAALLRADELRLLARVVRQRLGRG